METEHQSFFMKNVDDKNPIKFEILVRTQNQTFKL